MMGSQQSLDQRLSYLTHAPYSKIRPSLQFARARMGRLADWDKRRSEIWSYLRKAVDSRIGNLDLDHGPPTKDAVRKLFDEMDILASCLPVIRDPNLSA
jgi:hypothetical protein